MEKHSAQQDFQAVANAIDWAFRNSYVDGENAGKAFARLMGSKMSVRDGGLYADTLEFEPAEGLEARAAAPELLEALLEVELIGRQRLASGSDAEIMANDLQEKKELIRQAIAKATGQQ